MDILDRIETYLKESEIDWKKVKEALIETANDIFDKVDTKKIDGIVSAVKKSGKAKDTEDAIGIGQGMLRSD